MLYGLYKQATEGNVEGIIKRPIGNSSADESAKRKWDAWKQHQNLSASDAKRKYIAYLIDTMKIYASGTHEARELLSELEYLWDQIKDLDSADELDNEINKNNYNDLLYQEISHSSNFRPPVDMDAGSNMKGSSTGQTNVHLQDLYEKTSSNFEELKALKKEIKWAIESMNQEVRQLKQHVTLQRDTTSEIIGNNTGHFDHDAQSMVTSLYRYPFSKSGTTRATHLPYTSRSYRHYSISEAKDLESDRSNGFRKDRDDDNSTILQSIAAFFSKLNIKYSIVSTAKDLATKVLINAAIFYVLFRVANKRFKLVKKGDSVQIKLDIPKGSS